MQHLVQQQRFHRSSTAVGDCHYPKQSQGKFYGHDIEVADTENGKV